MVLHDSSSRTFFPANQNVNDNSPNPFAEEIYAAMGRLSNNAETHKSFDGKFWFKLCYPGEKICSDRRIVLRALKYFSSCNCILQYVSVPRCMLCS